MVSEKKIYDRRGAAVLVKYGRLVRLMVRLGVGHSGNNEIIHTFLAFTPEDDKSRRANLKGLHPPAM
jgi:hypothetical protein